MKKKVSIVTSGHPYYDERIFYKFARSLNKNGHETSIICSTANTEIDLVKDNIHILGFDGSNLKKSRKLNKFEELLRKAKSDVIICCEPLPILAANKVRCDKKDVKIIYDVTEWYPENVAFKFEGIKRFVNYVSLFVFNIFVSNLASALIVGEKGKKVRYDLIAPFKKKQIISYYPVLEFFDFYPPKFDDKHLVFCYAGLLKFDRGIKTILKSANKFAELNNQISVTLKLIGKFESKQEESEFTELAQAQNKIKVEFAGWTEYLKISILLADVHVCFDLRERTFIYRNSLPIKIFEYMACGKPFIFTNIKPIRQEFDYSTCGFLANPEDINEIVSYIQNYIDDKDLFLAHSENARRIIENEKNWEKESDKLVAFIESL